MNTSTIEKNILVKDLDGHWYSIPPIMHEEFRSLKESIIAAEWATDEWYEANDIFNDVFSEYMKGE